MMGIVGQSRARRLARHTENRQLLVRQVALAIALSMAVLALGSPAHIAQENYESVDLLIIGAGISGLSAALEAARGGASVLVVDMRAWAESTWTWTVA
jgi:heterodisulfide reductase subunit A-like polyferredoxin